MIVRILAVLFSLGLFAALGLALLERPVPAENLPARVTEALPASGVEHSVTAVLLNLRSFDTLLEIGVLLLAAVVALALHESQADPGRRMGLANPLLHAVMSWLLPLMLLVAAYLLWAGSTQAGGAFQAGAVLAATGVLLRLAGVLLPGFSQSWRMRALLAAGLAVFIAAGAVPSFSGRAFLAYPEGFVSAMILGIEFALALSIGAALFSLFKLVPPHAARGDKPGE